MEPVAMVDMLMGTYLQMSVGLPYIAKVARGVTALVEMQGAAFTAKAGFIQMMVT
jgi:hypothetical protein